MGPRDDVVSGPRGTLRVVASAIRAGRLRATDVVSAAVARLESHRYLNVLAAELFDEALHDAQRIDRDELRRGALIGLPMVVKDLDDLRGVPTRKGSVPLRDAARATRTGVVAERLLRAGAVVVGKSTLPEFAIEGFTANLLTGVTRNPWNPDYSPGGSSGGSAAAVSAGLVGIATATDGGGSVRIPASLCGLVGLKPTHGVIGRWPIPDWIDYSTDGPLATSSDDLRLLLDVMRGPVAGDPTSPPRGMLRHWPRHGDHPTVLFAAERTSPWGPLPHEVGTLFRHAVDAVADRLRTRVTWLEPEDFFVDGDPDRDWFVVTSAEHVASVGREWTREHMDQFHVATRDYLTTGLGVSIDDYLSARRRRFYYVRRMDEVLGRHGLLLTPTVAAPGWLADGRLREGDEVRGLPPEVYCTAVQNVTGHPALSLPFGHFASGIPFGVQLTAPRFHDYRLIDIAAVMEASYPWARTAPGYDGLETLVGLE